MQFCLYDQLHFILGEQGIDVFNQEAEKRNICIALGQKVPSGADEETYIDVRFC